MESAKLGPTLGPGLPPTWAQIALSWAELKRESATWSCWAKVGSKAIQMDPKEKQGDAHGSPSHVQASGPMDTTWVKRNYHR